MALTDLPWVDPDTIVADGNSLQVKFKVTDPSKYSDEAVKKVIADRGYPDATKLSGPSIE